MRGSGDSGAPGVPAVEVGTQCSAGVPSDPAGCVRVAEGVGHPSLFGFPPPASQRLSYPVSGLIFHESKWKGITMKIYVCFERGWFPSVGSRDRRFPFPFFIRALGSAGRRGAGGACLRGGRLITGLRVSRRAARLGEGLASESPPAGLEPAPASPQPVFVSPSAHPSSSRPLTSGTPVHPLLSLLFALLLVCGNAPFLWPLHPSALCFKGFPGKGTPWPGPTPPPPGARFGDSGESAEPRPTPELGPPALPAPRLAHAKACCVIPTWADIPCPGRSGVGLLIILSAADPRHQPIYCPVSPR